jgi:trimethylamine--corrinoid protein Co-methyltransferase
MDGYISGFYKPLPEEGVRKIHESALLVLKRTGVKVNCGEAISFFRAGGAHIDGDIVKLPENLVEGCLGKVPSKITLYGRDSRYNLHLEGERVHFGTGGAALNVLDNNSSSIRKATLKDIANLAKLVDKLENIHFFIRPVVAQDVPKDKLDVNKYYASLLHTNKHVMGSAYSVESAIEVIRMAEIIAGSEDILREQPFISFITCWMQSPLTFYKPTTEVMIEIVKQGIPVVLSSSPVAGSTSPVTLAGSLVQLHAEELAGITLTQLVNPGAPVIYGAVPSTANMKTMAFLGGAVEFGMLNSAAVQIANSLNLPNYSSAGLTESKVPDAQAGVEKALSIIQLALSGGNYIHHAAGMLESMLTVAYPQYVIDNDIIGMAMRVIKGISTEPDRLAVDVIDSVGPGGNYIGEMHTVQYMKDEHFFPRVLDRSTRKEWEENGSKDLWRRASELAENILKEDINPKLPSDIDRLIRKEFDILLPCFT